MQFPSKKLSIILTLAALLLNACADLGPIREYANASKDLTSGTELITRWKNSDLELAKAQPLFDDPIKLRRPKDYQSKADEAAKNLLKIHDALGKYFSVISALADDELPSVEKQSDNLSDSIQLLDSNFNKADQTAFKEIVNLLSIPLDAYRQKEVIKLIKSQDANVEKLLGILEQASSVIESDIKAESESSTQPYNLLLGDVKDKGIRFLVKERMLSNKKTNYQGVLSAIAQYRNAIVKVKEQHKKIAATANSDKSSFKKLAAELRDAKEQISSAKKAVELAIHN